MCAGYSRRDNLRDLHFTISSGHFHAILGANGAGKTTLLRVLAGILPLRSGQIYWKTEDNTLELSRLPQLERASLVSYAPQLANNDLHLTVREAIDIAARTVKSAGCAGRASEAIEMFGLKGVLAAPCSALSGGIWRRVVLAQALAQGTAILLFDEPTTHLDPPARKHTLSLLRDLAECRDLCIVCVLHEPGLAKEFAHFVLALRDGQLLAAGPTEEKLLPSMLEQLYTNNDDCFNKIRR